MTFIDRITIRAALAAMALGLAAPVAAQDTLTFATTLPEGNPLVQQVFIPWVEALNQQGEGVLQVSMINGPTIADHSNVYERVSSGIVDMGWAILGSVGVPFPRTDVAALPFLATDPVSASAALWGVYQEGLLDDDFDRIELVALLALPAAGLHTNVPVTSAADLAGLRIRASDRLSSDLLTALGATPVSISTADAYQAISTGVLDGVYTGWAGTVLFRLEEVTDQHLDEDIGGGAAGVFVNEDTYAALSPESQAVLHDAGERLVRDLAAWYVRLDGVFRDRVAGTGDTINRLTPEELAHWQELGAPITAAWVETTPNGAAILARFQELLAAGQPSN
jgi:TRAP-type C4-dicarboxylate transport system, periplasmic component